MDINKFTKIPIIQMHFFLIISFNQLQDDVIEHRNYIYHFDWNRLNDYFKKLQGVNITKMALYNFVKLKHYLYFMRGEN